MRASLTVLALFAASTTLFAQQPPRGTQPAAPIEEATPEAAAPAQPMPEPSASTPLDQAPNLQEVNVDDNCRVLVSDRDNAAGHFGHPHYREDSNVCHLESIHHTDMYEENLDNGVLKRTRVQVDEATFVLKDVSPDPVAFLVHQRLFHGGHIDSNPQPDVVAENVATFRVYAKPGEVIHLHVGQRR
jgi:hypothetical protein